MRHREEPVMKASLFAITLFTALAASAQKPAPDAICDLGGFPANTPIRILQGADPVPYRFACQERVGCIDGQLNPGLLVAVGPQKDGWTCVTGSDSTYGWVPTSRLTPVPADPRIPLADWFGVWHQDTNIRGIKDDRLQITPGNVPGTLHIAGNAYWYGRPGLAHFGGVNAEAAPVGLYLHAVEDGKLSGCVLNLRYDPVAHAINAFDNGHCGGLHVRFSGVWARLP
jgi:hypothetical protein